MTDETAQAARGDHASRDRRGVPAPGRGGAARRDRRARRAAARRVEARLRLRRGDRGRGAAARCGSHRLEARGVPRDDAERRIALQATDEERRTVATWVRRQLGDLAHLERQIDEIWPELERARAAADEPLRATDDRRRPRRSRRRELSHPVGTLDRVPEFELVTDSRRRAISPRRSRRWSTGVDAGRQVPDAARHHRLGQELHDRQRDRAGAAAHARAGAQQVARRAARGRVPRVLPEATGSSTSSPTTTTTSPRRTSRRPTRTSRRTARSTTRSTGCATRPRARC